jgi:rhamnose utilization protein RhaD (predicted bifunctional aldolase and dehydrogenase)
MTPAYISNEYLELDALRELSARLGANRLLVQASTGNTSVKIGDVLWIKASGKWLAQADARDFLVPVKLARARQSLAQNIPIQETLRSPHGDVVASIETAMHVVMPQKVVVHVHSVNTIAWAVRADAPQCLSSRLSGLNWQWTPYIPSGVALATSIQHALDRSPRTNVLVLGNHGLVVCGESCSSVKRLLTEVEERVAVTPRPAPHHHPALLRDAFPESAWSLPEWPAAHALATDSASWRIVSGGVLYPCQAIFLPGAAPTLAASLSRELQYLLRERMPLLIEKHGVVCSKYMTRADQEMLSGLTEIVQRIDPAAPIRYLNITEVLDVLQGGSDNYRSLTEVNYYAKQPAMQV